MADFPLQINYMIFYKSKPGWEFFFPLFTHAMVHALFTLAITLYFAPSVWWLFLVDLTIHFTMDRIKSSPALLGRFNDIGKASFWWCLGFDQMVHHLTDLLSIWMIIHHL